MNYDISVYTSDDMLTFKEHPYNNGLPVDLDLFTIRHWRNLLSFINSFDLEKHPQLIIRPCNEVGF